MITFFSGDYSELYVFARRTSTLPGSIRFLAETGENAEQEEVLNEQLYALFRFALKRQQTCHLTWEHAEITQIYLAWCPDQMERGVTFLSPATGNEINLKDWYDTPIREQFHFSPFINWMNDPNGLCWYQGYFHLFYQSNPFGQKWDDIFWGHAVSKDLVHWIHQPHVLEPQPGLQQDASRKGGAFSGCAWVTDDRMQLYLTRHDGPLQDGWETAEWQTTAICRDGLHIEDEQILISDKPKGAGFDFRDPAVDKIDGQMTMVLGSAIDGIPSILLYRQDKEGNWVYQGPLLQERTSGIRTFECPDFFKLDGTYVALGACMEYTDEANRYNMTRCYIGTYDGKRLLPEQEQWFDFGSNFYAVQSFLYQGRRLAIGWISDFMNEHREIPDGAYGSMSLPRELHIKNGRLYMRPARECDALNGDCLLKTGVGTHAAVDPIPGNAYHATVSLKGDGDFTIVLARDGEDSLSLVRKDGETSLISTKANVRNIRFPSGIRNVREIEIYTDRRLTEVFLNEGEAAGAKLFYQDSRDGCFEGFFADGDLNALQVHAMQTIWK